MGIDHLNQLGLPSLRVAVTSSTKTRPCVSSITFLNSSYTSIPLSSPAGGVGRLTPPSENPIGNPSRALHFISLRDSPGSSSHCQIEIDNGYTSQLAWLRGCRPRQ